MCGSLWPQGVGRGKQAPGVDPRDAPRRMTRFCVKTWVEPGGGRPNRFQEALGANESPRLRSPAGGRLVSPDRVSTTSWNSQG